MILDMIQGCRYLRRSTDRWLLSKNSTTRLEGLESWHGAGLLYDCSIPITITKGSYLYPGFDKTPSRLRLQYLFPKNNITSIPYSSSIRSFPRIQSTSSRTPEYLCFSLQTTPLPNDDALPTAKHLCRML